MKTIIVKEHFDATPEMLYKAWLDSKMHSEMTGAPADCSSKVMGSFTAWDGYVSGYNQSLEPYKKIVQSWRTTDFSDDDADSTLTIEFSATNKGCLLTLTHQHIPDGQPDYKKGWKEYYFKPMKQYFKKKKQADTRKK